MNEKTKKTSVSIDTALYIDIKEFCSLNGLKANDKIEEWLRNSLAEEKWGDAPFYTKKEPAPETTDEQVIEGIKPVEVQDVPQVIENNNVKKPRVRVLK